MIVESQETTAVATVADKPDLFAVGEHPSHTLSNPDYHAIDALSASGIKTLLQSPMHYRYQRDTPHEETSALKIGTLLHMAILEPGRWNTEIVVIPDDAPKRPTMRQILAKKPSAETAAAVAWWQVFEAKAKGMTSVDADDFEKVSAMAAAVRRHPIYDSLIAEESTLKERSMMWLDARLGIRCKCRFDALTADGIGIDLKTTQDASADAFARSVAQYRYHLQAAWYNTGHEHVRNQSLRAWLFVAVESVAPYGVQVHHLEPNAIAFGANRCEEAMLLYQQASSTGYWRGYPESVNRLVLPKWATTIAPSL